MRKLIGYVRVSTEDQGVSGNGLEAQREAITRFAATNGCELVEIVTEVASGKLELADRPVLREALLRARKEDMTLVVSKLDRLSRKALFVLNMMNTSARFVVAEFGFDADEFMVHIHAILAEKERKLISTRTRDALRQLKNKGVALGHTQHKDKKAIIGARLKAGQVVSRKADDFAMRMRPSIERMSLSGMSMSAIAREFNGNGTKTARGGAWTPTTVKNVMARWAH